MISWRRAPGEHPLVFSHRGLALDVFENTISAYEKAVRIGVDGIEMDVSMTSDGVLVCFHDKGLERISGVKDRLRDTRFGKLRSIPLEGRERIATLDEALDVIGTSIPIILDVKPAWDADVAIVGPLARLLRRRALGAAQNITCSCLSWLVLANLADTLPGLRAALILPSDSWRSRPGLWNHYARRWKAIHPQRGLINPVDVQRWHRMGWNVGAWTVNEQDEARRMADSGADLIITDRPDLVRFTSASASASASP